MRTKDGREFVQTYDPAVSRNWKATAHEHMRRKFPCPIPANEPVRIDVEAVFTCPKSDYRKRVPRPRRWHTKRPDADNVLKAAKDAGKGILWLDDSQVVDERIVKKIGAQAEAPYLRIRVQRIGV